MALNLLRAGFRLTVHNRHPERTVPLREAGAAVANTPAEAAAAADLLLICVSDDAAVEAVLLEQPGAAIEGLRPGALVIDCSTIAPTSSCRLAARLAERNIGYLDAPVTGGTEGARAGTLSVLVGGSPEHLERARPLLEVIGGRITSFGAVGAGQRAKAVNQVLVAGSYAAVAEALALAERLGLDRPQVVEALKGGAAGSWALEHRSAGMIADHYPLGFKLALHRKDLAIALAAAAEAQLTLPITAQVAALEDALISAGEGEQDVSVLARWFRVRD
jgi:3-hydroxyisobutyrate dehydrogenase-like beta-hydroxyacid dehydrogenase